jgi:hypothetical protein
VERSQHDTGDGLCRIHNMTNTVPQHDTGVGDSTETRRAIVCRPVWAADAAGATSGGLLMLSIWIAWLLGLLAGIELGRRRAQP